MVWDWLLTFYQESFIIRLTLVADLIDWVLLMVSLGFTIGRIWQVSMLSRHTLLGCVARSRNDDFSVTGEGIPDGGPWLGKAAESS